MRLLIILLSALLIASGCAPQSSTPVPTEALEPGDATRGAALFTESINGAPSCSTCHTLDGSTSVGPSFQNYAENALEHAGESSIEEYTHTSIVQPGAYIVPGHPNGMYSLYERNLSEQQIADLIAYLLTL